MFPFAVSSPGLTPPQPPKKMKAATPPVVAVALGFISLMGMQSQAATSLTFDLITATYSGSVATVNLTGLIADNGLGGVDITITNNSVGTTSPTVTDIYFNNNGNVLGSFGSIFTDSGAGVDYAAAVAGGNLPGGNTIGLPNGSIEFTYGPNPPPSSNGLDPGEFITFRFSGVNYNDVVTGFGNSNVQIGLHLQELPNVGGASSASFISTPPENTQVPEPTAATLAGLAGALMLLRRRRV